MANLLTEYRNRRGLKSVCPMNEGIQFFDKANGDPAMVLLTSSFSKSVNSCVHCPQNMDMITLEMFALHAPFDIYPTLVNVKHIHIGPDADILDYIRLHLQDGAELIPYVSKGDRDQERWLWNFFLGGLDEEVRPMMDRYIKQVKKTTSKWSEELVWLTQVDWLIRQAPEAFMHFYSSIYETCMINRKYLLLS